jgi:hypothetical protein
MKKIILGMLCALSLMAFAAASARADEKPADANATAAARPRRD